MTTPRWTVCAALIACLSAAPSAGQSPVSPDASYALVGPTFIALRVNNVDAVSRWYGTVLGLVEVNRIDAEDGRYSIRTLSNNDLTVELVQERGVGQPAERHLGLFKAGLYVTDVDGMHTYLRRLGVAVDVQPFTDDTLGARSFVFRDPEGNQLQAFQPCDGPCG